MTYIFLRAQRHPPLHTLVMTVFRHGKRGVAKPIWMVGDSPYDTPNCHDHLLAAGVVPVAPFNVRNTDDPKDIKYRIEDCIEQHSKDIQLKQSTLDERYSSYTPHKIFTHSF